MPKPWAVCQTPINCSGCGYGSGFRSTPSTTLKITVLAPTPAASVTRRDGREYRRTPQPSQNLPELIAKHFSVPGPAPGLPKILDS